jgi:hypothetical protein
MTNDEEINDLATRWDSGGSLAVGKIIYEKLPIKSRPKWASRVLKIVLDRSQLQLPLFSRLLELAEQEGEWKYGHDIFSELRSVRLELDNLGAARTLNEHEMLLGSVVSFAELVAKVIYNATDPQDPFDDDSGWWIVSCLRDFVDRIWVDEQFRTAAWFAISARE